MGFFGTLAVIVIIYMAYQMGRIKGRAEMILEKGTNRKMPTDKIEEADYEEIK